MNTYAFLTNDSFRIEVKASTPKAAYNKLISISQFKNRVTRSWVKFNKDGLASAYDYKVTF